jgi:hypothetical protein
LSRSSQVIALTVATCTSPYASLELNAQRCSADDYQTLLDVLDDDALAAFQGVPQSPLAVHCAAAMRHDLQIAGRWIEQLHVATTE